MRRQLALDQVILRPAVHRLHRKSLVGRRPQDDHGYARALGPNQIQIAQPGAVRQEELHDDHVERLRLQQGQPLLQGFHHLHRHRVAAGDEHLHHRARKLLIMLDEQNFQRLIFHDTYRHGARGLPLAPPIAPGTGNIAGSRQRRKLIASTIFATRLSRAIPRITSSTSPSLPFSTPSP